MGPRSASRLCAANARVVLSWIDACVQAVVASGLWDLLPGGRPSSPYGDYTPRSMQGAAFRLSRNLCVCRLCHPRNAAARAGMQCCPCAAVEYGHLIHEICRGRAEQQLMMSGVWFGVPPRSDETRCADHEGFQIVGKTPFTENGKSGPADGRSARPAIAAAGPPKPRRRPPPAPPGGH